MTKKEYEEYQQAVANFFELEGLRNLSAISCEPYFSWHRCVCCGDPLGGNRYDCNGWSERDQEVKEFHGVCEDCVYYAEYGRLDDTTMMEIEKDAT